MILTEFTLAVGFMLRRYHPVAIWVALAYHRVLVLTAESTFGLFWYFTAASYLAFVDWPAEPTVVRFGRPGAVAWAVHGLLSRLDVDRVFAWSTDLPLCATGVIATWQAAAVAASRVPAVYLAGAALIALPFARYDYAAACAVFAVLLAVAASAGVRLVQRGKNPAAPGRRS